MLKIVTLPSGQKIETQTYARSVRIYLHDEVAPRSFTWGFARKFNDDSRDPPVAPAVIEINKQWIDVSCVAAFVEILEYAKQLAVEMDKRYPPGVEVEQ